MHHTEMEDSEKLMALKKAYADMIHNTAKEAAARIIVSERKAMSFQQELVSNKEESLRMLLRLKHMLDSKVNEAEMMSLSQQKKIEELEAMLEEAEEIVRDLRAELRETQAVLDKVTNNKMHSQVAQNIEGENAAQENCLQENRLDPSDGSVYSVPDLLFESVATNDSRSPTVNGTNDSSKFYVPHDRINNCYMNNPDFASIVIRRKEPELNQSGCTQRICAFERNLFGGVVALTRTVDVVQNETLARVGEGKVVPVTTNPKADIICERDKPDEVKAVNVVVDHVNVSVHKTQGSLKELPGTTHSEVDIICETDKPDEVKAVHATTMVEQSRYHNDTEKDEEFLEACSAGNKVKDDKELLDKSDLTRQESLSTESSDVSARKADVDMAKGSSDKLDPKASDLDEKVYSQSVSDKFLKYTFQRKRKKHPISVRDMDCSLENGSSKKKCGEKQNGHVEPQKSCTMAESTRDSRRLAQVARQQIHL